MNGAKLQPAVWLSYAVLLMGVLIVAFPFIWMVATAFKPAQEVYSLRLVPQNADFGHLAELLTRTPFGQWMGNSVWTAAVTTLSVLLFDTVAGYILAQFEFRGKQVVFILIMATLMVPTEMLLIPWYILSAKWGWIDTSLGIVFPGLMTAFGVFLMRKFMETVPRELLDAARIDGLGEFGILFRIALPLVKPALATLTILTFLQQWNSFIWPLIVTQTPERLTIPVGLALFSSESNDSGSWALMMTGAAVAVIPLVVIFALFQRQIVRGIAWGGFK